MFGFDPPKSIKAEAFAEVPAAFRVPSRKAPAPTRLAAAGTTLEGPCFDKEGNLFFTDIPNGRIFMARPDGRTDLFFEYDGEPNGLKFDAHQSLIIADHHLGILRLDPVGKVLSTVITGPMKERFKGVNDLTFSREGDLYFTDQGATGMHDPSGRVYRLSADGRLETVIGNVPSPNGLALNPAETVLYVAATRSSSIWIVPLDPTGDVSRVGIFARLPGGGPDGMATDAGGNLAVAHPSLSTVWLFSPKGLPIFKIQPREGAHLTNVVYGGSDRRSLYITDGENFCVWRAEMPVAG